MSTSQPPTIVDSMRHNSLASEMFLGLLTVASWNILGRYRQITHIPPLSLQTGAFAWAMSTTSLAGLRHFYYYVSGSRILKKDIQNSNKLIPAEKSQVEEMVSSSRLTSFLAFFVIGSIVLTQLEGVRTRVPQKYHQYFIDLDWKAPLIVSVLTLIHCYFMFSWPTYKKLD